MTTASILRGIIFALAALTFSATFVAETTVVANAAVFPSAPGR